MKNFFDFVARRRLQWLIAVCLVAVIGDQSSKIWAQNYLAEPYKVSQEIIEDGESKTVIKEIFYPVNVVEVVPNFLNFIYKENPAAAFSLTHSLPTWFRRPLLISVSVLATIFFTLWYFRMRARDGFLLASFSFILGGAVGNLLDRARLGYVIDFLDVHAGLLGYPHWHWPTFNVADSFIVVGAIGVIARTIWPLKLAGTHDEDDPKA